GPWRPGTGSRCCRRRWSGSTQPLGPVRPLLISASVPPTCQVRRQLLTTRTVTPSILPILVLDILSYSNALKRRYCLSWASVTPFLVKRLQVGGHVSDQETNNQASG